MTSEVVSEARSAVERGDGGLSVQQDGLDFEISGDLDKGTTFDGDVVLSGTASKDRRDYAYEVFVGFDRVESEDGTVVDGDLSLVFYANDAGDGDFEITVGISIDGQVEVSGKATGQADISYDVELQIDGLNVGFEAGGTINGRDVSGFPDDVTITL
jgi:hypothetical protein